MKFSKKSFYIYIIALCFVSVNCASLGTYNAATGKNEFIFISTPDEISMGQNIHQTIQQESEISNNQSDLSRVQRVGQRLALVSDRQDYPYNFFVINKNELNAFTTPGGNIYVYTGLLHKLKTDDELAGVLAHEIGHCAARHTVKKFQAALGYDLLSSLILNTLETENTKKVAVVSSSVIMTLVFSAYSRQDEFEADRLGIKYMNLSGYNLNGMIKVLELLDKEASGGDVPLILRTHPFTKDRIEKAKLEIYKATQQFNPNL